MKTIIIDNDKVTLFHHTGMTRFTGCQCFKDCSCSEDFTPVYYDYYTVRKKFNKPSTSNHKTLEEAKNKIEELETISINYYTAIFAPKDYKGKIK